MPGSQVAMHALGVLQDKQMELQLLRESVHVYDLTAAAWLMAEMLRCT